MQLIGGVLVEGELRKEVVLKPLTGMLELELAEAGTARASASLPEAITRLLTTAIATLGNKPATADRVADMSVGDRQHLTRMLGTVLGSDLLWLTCLCSSCGEKFDLEIRQSKLPVKARGAGYPERTVSFRGQSVTVRSPTGRDQAAIAQEASEETATAALLERLVSGDADFRVAKLGEDEVAVLEAAIEEMAPEVAEEAMADCPECGANNRIEIDPYLTLSAATPTIYEEVHLLASTYHWSEAAVLALPKDRRKRYLSLIDRQRGVMSDARDPVS